MHADLTPLTTCVTRRSTTTLASASASRRARCRARARAERACPSIAISAARSRSASKPNVSHAPSIRAQRPLERQVAPQVERHLGAGRALDRRPAHLAVALRGVAVAGREERAVDRDRQVERRSGDELLAVDVAALRPRRARRVDARGDRRHAEHAEERPRGRRGGPSRRPDAVGELPGDAAVVGAPTSRPTGRARPRRSARRACRRRARRDGDRAGEACPSSSGRRRRLEPRPVVETPAGVRRREAHRVAGVDLEHRVEVAREVPVQRPALERQLVDHRSGSRPRPRRARPTARTRPRATSTDTGRRSP